MSTAALCVHAIGLTAASTESEVQAKQSAEPNAEPEKKDEVAAEDAPATNAEDAVPSPDSVIREGDGFWDERWKSHFDSKPRGPTSFGADVAFLRSSHVYGIPERAAPFALPPTKSSDGTPKGKPYRLYNLDVFEYEVEGRDTQPLYGSIPFMMGIGHNGKTTVAAAMLWLNAAETYIDVVEGQRDGYIDATCGRPNRFI